MHETLFGLIFLLLASGFEWPLGRLLASGFKRPLVGFQLLAFSFLAFGSDRNIVTSFLAFGTFWLPLVFGTFWPLTSFGLWHLLASGTFWAFGLSFGLPMEVAQERWRRRFLVIKAVGVVEMLKIYIFTEEGNELELETNVSK